MALTMPAIWGISAKAARMDEAIGKAVTVFLANEHADQHAMLAALAAQGFTPREAWRIYQFVPIAFMHVAFRGTGVTFQPGFERAKFERAKGATSVLSKHLLADEPLYVAGVRAAERLIANGYAPAQLLPVFRQSAEYNCMRKLQAAGSHVRDLVFVEPLLIDYED